MAEIEDFKYLGSHGSKAILRFEAANDAYGWCHQARARRQLQPLPQLQEDGLFERERFRIIYKEHEASEHRAFRTIAMRLRLLPWWDRDEDAHFDMHGDVPDVWRHGDDGPDVPVFNHCEGIMHPHSEWLTVLSALNDEVDIEHHGRL